MGMGVVSQKESPETQEHKAQKKKSPAINKTNSKNFFTDIGDL